MELFRSEFGFPVTAPSNCASLPTALRALRHQKGERRLAQAWSYRMVGDLPLEGRIPPPGNSGSARRAGTIRSEIVAGDQIAVAFDEQLVAVGAVGVFQFSNLARQIPCIDECRGAAAEESSTDRVSRAY